MSRSTFRRRPLRLTALALVAALAVASHAASPAGATEDFALTRVSGIDRYGTAAAIATDAYTTAATVVVATGVDYPDALAGSFLAGAVDGPILLTVPGHVPGSTSRALAALRAEKVVLLGGEAAISKAVEAELAQNYAVSRITGADRFDTARAIAEAGAAATGAVGQVNGKDTAIVASGRGYADALGAGALAAAGKLPILLTERDRLSPAAANAIRSLGIDHVVIAGGPAAVAAGVETDLKALGVTVERVFGDDRYATSTALAEFAIAELGFVDTHVNLARGDDFPNGGGGFADGLAGAPHAAVDGPAPIVLTSGSALSAATQTFLEDHAATLADGHVFGGAAAVSDAVVEDAHTAARATAAEVVRFDTAANRYTSVAPGATEAQTVEYAEGDEFTVDDAPATIGGFEAQLSHGDRIVTTITSGGQRHKLLNVDPSEINGRTVGNVDTADNQFDFINDVTGDFVRRNITYKDADRFEVDGTSANVETFEKDLNEGDVLTIETTAEGPVYSLANRAITGIAVVLAKATTRLSADLQIGPYGDIPGTSSDSATDPAGSGNDDRYRTTSSDGDKSSDAFSGEATSFREFFDELTDGDEVTYSRVGGVQTFILVNKPLPTVTGTAVSITKGTTADNDPLKDTNDGGKMTLEVNGTNREFTYQPGGSFLIDGKVSTEAEFESQFNAGDTVTYRPADPAANQTQRIELTKA